MISVYLSTDEAQQFWTNHNVSKSKKLEKKENDLYRNYGTAVEVESICIKSELFISRYLSKWKGVCLNFLLYWIPHILISSAVTQLPGKHTAPGMQVLVQGNQVVIVAKFLLGT